MCLVRWSPSLPCRCEGKLLLRTGQLPLSDWQNCSKPITIRAQAGHEPVSSRVQAGHRPGMVITGSLCFYQRVGVSLPLALALTLSLSLSLLLSLSNHV